MSVFAEYAPYTLATGTWDERREAVADEAFAEIARFAPDIVDCVVARQVLAPPDIERGGRTRPADTSSRASASPIRCGTAASPPHADAGPLHVRREHPSGGSVMAINGRNCAMAVLADTKPEHR